VRHAFPVALASVVVLAGCAASAPVGVGDELSGTVTVLAAASLRDVFDDLADRFRSDYPDVEIVLGYGGSSGLAEQIISGAPADVFAAANPATMSTVSDAGLAVEPVVFATNTLQIAVPRGNPGNVAGIADLARPELAIALCDPTVPCGAAAVEVLDRAGVTASVDTLEEDVRAALTKAALGEVDAALVYRTDVIAAGGEVEAVEVPEASEVVNVYAISPLTEARNPEAARAFLDLVLSATGRTVLERAGFGAP